MSLVYNNLCRQNYKTSWSKFESNCSKTLNFLSFSFPFSSAVSLISRFIQRHRRESQAPTRVVVDAAITFFPTYEYHKSFRHSFAQKKKENEKIRKRSKKGKRCLNINKSSLVPISITNLYKKVPFSFANSVFKNIYLE